LQTATKYQPHLNIIDSGDLIASILNGSPPLQNINALVDIFSKLLIGRCSDSKRDDEQFLEAFAEVVCTAGVNTFYEEGYRHKWIKVIDDL
jgi:uncharacterized UPF0160 family protein